ncbi:MAG: class I SAM-dependent methyltransferase, partial [Candidatus Roizmanbacteria bacterium]|nr:class I SAM-dependent methyltransferase [Candidatus Roizmanbacteria bacterium]
MKDLNSQQEHLSSTSYDLRITNLARFIYSRIRNENYVIPDSDRESMDPRMREDDMRLKFLDIGAGNGLFLKFFKEKGFEVAGYELEQKNVDNMKKDPVLKSVSIVQADITNLRGSENFDVVMASDVIEHIKDDVLAIKNLWSFVKSGGMMLITVPAHSYLYGKRDKKWGHHRRYDAEVLLERINEVINTTPSPDKSGETPPYKGGE